MTPHRLAFKRRWHDAWSLGIQGRSTLAQFSGVVLNVQRARVVLF
jgi:hypothetical protein